LLISITTKAFLRLQPHLLCCLPDILEHHFGISSV
jgi:hypothetical protein